MAEQQRHPACCPAVEAHADIHFLPFPIFSRQYWLPFY